MGDNKISEDYLDNLLKTIETKSELDTILDDTDNDESDDFLRQFESELESEKYSEFINELDFDDDEPVPAKIADNDDFWGGLDEIGVPDKDGINSFELTDEQANYMLRHFKPISDFSPENEYDCLVQIKDDEESLKTFIRTNVEF